ncbi:MAG: hypothetical protein WKG07_14725 [Hymenobacter sp.]
MFVHMIAWLPDARCCRASRTATPAWWSWAVGHPVVRQLGILGGAGGAGRARVLWPWASASRKVDFFPKGDPKFIYTYLKMPVGTRVEVTDSDHARPGKPDVQRHWPQ